MEPKLEDFILEDEENTNTLTKEQFKADKALIIEKYRVGAYYEGWRFSIGLHFHFEPELNIDGCFSLYTNKHKYLSFFSNLHFLGLWVDCNFTIYNRRNEERKNG